jgi:acyl-CoA thioester hydrolase
MTMPSVTCVVRPHFYDCDPMNVVWHGNYARFFEEARTKLLELIDYNYYEMHDSGFAWPVVTMTTKYISPIFLHQDILVEAVLMEFENRMRIKFTIRDKASLKIMTKSEMVQVALCLKTNIMVFETPQVFQDKVRKLLP